MTEAFILRTVSLHTSAGVVHIETVGFNDDEKMIIEYDARALLEDLPSFYTMCKQAIEQDNKYQLEKFSKFIKEIKEDIE